MKNIFKITLGGTDVEQLLTEKDIENIFNLPMKEVLEMGFKIERREQK